MKSILLYANEDHGLEARLQCALDLVQTQRGHLTCVQAVPYNAYVPSDPFGGMYAVPELLKSIEDKKAAHRHKLEEQLRRAQIPWTWMDDTGEAAPILVERARLSDLVVVSLPNGSERRSPARVSLAADVAVHARTPVVAVPATAERFDCSGRALVAWNGSAEAGHALRAALPLLRQAAAVDVVTVCEQPAAFPATEACEYLGHHGIRPELHERRRNGESVASCLLAAARELGSAYLVMGAYGHSRLREAVLGGVTRELIDTSDVPLLLAH